jgi:adenosylhomocysteinase
MRITNRITNGQRVTVFGYGACGGGVAANFRAANAKVSVVELDPVKRLRAHLDGFDTPRRDEAIMSADVIVTVTGGTGVLGPKDLALFKDGVIIANAGHFPVEVDAKGIAASPEVNRRDLFEDAIEELTLADGRLIRIVAGGHMVNLAGPRPMGNSIETMDLGFALQARSLEAVALGRVGRGDCVVPVPRAINEQVAEAYLNGRYS